MMKQQRDETFDTREFLLECWESYQRALRVLSEETMSTLVMEEEGERLHESSLTFIQQSSLGMPCVKEFVVAGTRDDLSLASSFYITLNQNVRVVNPTPIIYENLTPYSINHDPSEQQSHVVNALKDRMQDIQHRNKSYFTPHEEQFITLLCQQLAKRCSGYKSLTKIKELAQLMQKDPLQIVKRFAMAYKKTMSPPQGRPHMRRKHFFYGSCDQFCNICFLYSCSTHYPQSVRMANELYEPEHKDFLFNKSDSPYESRIKPNFEAMRRISLEAEQCDYKCQDGCRDTTPQVRLKKFQKHWVDMLCGYGVVNPCLIAKCLRNVDYAVISCVQIKSFLEGNLSLRKSFAERGFISPLTKKRPQPNLKHALKDDIISPCFHDSACGTQECTCERCYKFCCCPPTCSKRVGCSCSDCGIEVDGKFQCPCRAKRIECDPDVCACPALKQQITMRPRSQRDLSCINTPVTFGVSPRLVLSKSLICEGLGLFAGQLFERLDFIGEYRGVILDEQQSSMIECLNQVTDQHYLFMLNSEEQVDGKRMGNKTRFVNHALPPVSNCDCQVVVVNGNYKVQMYAKRTIQVGEELFFDYSEEFKTEWKLAFDKKSNQYFKTKR